MLQAGEFVQLIVERSSPFGFFLSDGKTDVLLHQNETIGEVKVGETIEVFLYHDHQNRLSATQHKPILQVGEVGWIKVTDVEPRLGLFLHNGISKDILLPANELPGIQERWPKPGFEVFVRLDRDRQGRMLALLGTEEDLTPLSKKADFSLRNKDMIGRVYNETKIGAFLFTDDGYIGLIHREDMTTPLKIGQRVEVRVTGVREDGRLNLSMKPRKELSYSIDAERVLTYLKQRGGRMPYGDETAPDVIQLKFGISKGAFKRALGKLMKDRIVEQKEGWTYLRNPSSPDSEREKG